MRQELGLEEVDKYARAQPFASDVPLAGIRECGKGRVAYFGMLPDIAHKKFRYIGNSSLTGAQMLLTSQIARNRLKTLVENVQYLDLSNECNYFDHYTAALFIPHTDARLFPTQNRKT